MASPATFIYLPVAALAGVATALLLSRSTETAAPDKPPPAVGAAQTLVPLPDDPEVIRLAALAGRTGEARLEIVRLYAAGATDGELAEWLAPVLIADPGWFEIFLKGVEEERRMGLASATITAMAELAPDSVWELVKVSPTALASIRPDGSGPSFRLPYDCKRSRLAGEVLFDPAFGFSDREIEGFFRHGSESPENAARLLEEWLAGRWRGELPECVGACWASLRHRDGATLREIEARAPEDLRVALDSFSAGWEAQSDGKADLARLASRELAEHVETAGWNGNPVPLKTLAELSPEARGEALESYFRLLYPFHADEARAAVDSLDTLDFSPQEKRLLLTEAARYEWGSQGDIDRALELVAKIPEPEERTKLQRGFLEELAKEDPHAALSRAEALPAGELRDAILKAATEALP